MTTTLLREDRDGLCILTLNRPEKLNALDTELFEALEQQLIALNDARQAIGCVVLRGAGRAFCAGADLHAMGTKPIPPAFKPGVIERLACLHQPVIAAVHGICFTGGLELALACDFIVADTSARFADTHGKWGLVGEWGITQRLPRRIGLPAAKKMMFTGREISAAEANALGLVDELAPDNGLDIAVDRLAQEILANSWFSNAATKRLLIETDGMSLAEGLAHEHFRHPGFAPDYQDRIAAFTRKK